MDETHYIQIENLKDYKYDLCVANLHTYKYEHTQDTQVDAMFKPEKTHYWIIDSPGDFALAHWIYESFIFIHILIGLNEKIANIKILTKNHKKYVKSMLCFFEIKNEVVNVIDNYNNTCYYPKIYSINTSQQIEEDTYYNLYINSYINYIQCNIQSNIQGNIQGITTVFLPRNNADNYLPNDRTINNTDKIKATVIENGGTVLDTYALNNIKYQFTIINNADVVILDFGSSFLFNCIFLKNKRIYVIDNENQYQFQSKFAIINLIYKKINSNNEVTIITSHDPSIFENITKKVII
jgi:hypothetical protein